MTKDEIETVIEGEEPLVEPIDAEGDLSLEPVRRYVEAQEGEPRALAIADEDLYLDLTLGETSPQVKR